ncbi:MAG: alpha/beta fold hydrolase [Microvirga sp.]
MHVSGSRRLSAILAADIANYSALMQADEDGTVRELKSRQDVIMPMITEFGGRLIDTAGDGILAEFNSVLGAAECAVSVQGAMAEENALLAPARLMQFRIGINLGDIIHDGARIYGDGINIASRLEALAEPGGICMSRRAFDLIEGRMAVGVQDLGPQNLKNIAKPVDAVAIVAHSNSGSAKSPRVELARLRQTVKYCRTPDGVRLAYATAGQGPILVKTANWLNHLEYDWESPIWRHLLRALASEYTLVRYDARGNGLSDWDVSELSVDAWVSDLETVVDVAGLERFPLFAISQGCAVAVAYAVKHPEKASHLILFGGFAVGARRRSKESRELRDALVTFARIGWGSDNPSFRQVFTGRMFPSATQEQADAFNDHQRRTTSPECAARYLEATGDIDVADLLGAVTIPTLVMHMRGDIQAPIENGKALADGIPGARFVALPGENHVFLEGEPAGDRFFEELRLFLKQ